MIWIFRDRITFQLAYLEGNIDGQWTCCTHKAVFTRIENSVLNFQIAVGNIWADLLVSLERHVNPVDRLLSMTCVMMKADASHGGLDAGIFCVACSCRTMARVGRRAAIRWTIFCQACSESRYALYRHELLSQNKHLSICQDWWLRPAGLNHQCWFIAGMEKIRLLSYCACEQSRTFVKTKAACCFDRICCAQTYQWSIGRKIIEQ